MSAESEEPAMPLMAHLVELRNRLILCIGVLIVAFGVSYVFADDIYGFLVRPLANAMEGRETAVPHRLIYTHLTEAFFTYMSVALWMAVFVTSPFLLLQLWRFLAPGLYVQEKRLFIPYFIMTPFLFLGGAALAYYFVFPAAWSFFLSFENAHSAGALPIQLEARVGEYLNLSMTLILAFGFAFELPLGLVLMVHLGMVSVAQLRKFRRYAVVACFVVAAVVTPPDVISQLCLAIPLCLLYEIAVLAGALIEKTRARRVE